MPDNFDQRLREGAARFAEDITAAPVHLIRARGDQRRRRKVAGSVALAIAVIAGGGAAYAIGQPGHSAAPLIPRVATTTPPPRVTPTQTGTPSASTPSTHATSTPGSGATGTASPGGGTRTLRLGHLSLRVPQAWRVTYSDAQGDYTVSTGACPGDDLIGAAAGSPCAAFSLIADAGATDYPALTTRTYVRSAMYTTSTGAIGCPGKPTSGNPYWLRLEPGNGQPYYSGFAPVTSTRTADYTVWQLGCRLGGNGTSPPSFYFQQRDWYLPVSRILIVDEYSIPGLAQILATATWQ